MVESKQTSMESPSKKVITWEKFLVSYPPGEEASITTLAERYTLRTPDLELYCDNESCKGTRFFECNERGATLDVNKWAQRFLYYYCRNCRSTAKIFAVMVKRTTVGRGKAIKLGEWPPFGPHVPSRVITLIREDKELFNMGQRAESQGMGIGAFAYYRRVVENQKGRIIDEIIKVAERINAPRESIDKLKLAREERQFKKAVESIKDAIPQVLLVNGHNPLTLLHNALSEGLHAQSDKECLELATSIRTILTDLTERLDEALKGRAGLDKAVTYLLKSKSEKGSKAENKPQ